MRITRFASDRVMRTDLLLVLVLWTLAAYHLVMGATALLLPSAAARAMHALYGMTVPEGDAWRYMTSMIGALALTVGVLLLVAARAPAEHRAIIAAVLLLQGSRLLCRIRDRHLLAAALGVTMPRNLTAILALSAECGVLAAWLA